MRVKLPPLPLHDIFGEVPVFGNGRVCVRGRGSDAATKRRGQVFCGGGCRGHYKLRLFFKLQACPGSHTHTHAHTHTHTQSTVVGGQRTEGLRGICRKRGGKSGRVITE